MIQQSNRLSLPLGPLMIDIAGTELNDLDRGRLCHPLVGGMILFSRNYASPEQLTRLCAEIHALRSPNRAFWWVVAGALGFLATALYVPSLRDLFRFSILHTDDLLICTGAGFLSSVVIELLKFKHFRK